MWKITGHAGIRSLISRNLFSTSWKFIRDSVARRHFRWDLRRAAHLIWFCATATTVSFERRKLAAMGLAIYTTLARRVCYKMAKQFSLCGTWETIIQMPTAELFLLRSFSIFDSWCSNKVRVRVPNKFKLEKNEQKKVLVGGFRPPNFT